MGMKNNFLIILLCFSSIIGKASGKTVNGMAPLHIQVYNDPCKEEQKDWIDFESYLRYADSVGIGAVTVDVWWGMVQKYDKDTFEWAYYDKLFGLIKSRGLDIVPIMSFHQCGGNVGDNYYAPVPQWVWGEMKRNNPAIGTEDDLKYKSLQAKICPEYVSLWADTLVLTYYKRFLEEFSRHFDKYATNIPEINISCGPAGELRYPSYNSHDNWSYPQIGNLQCYSSLAKKSFQDYVKNLYGSVVNLNKSWNSKLSSFNDVAPPSNTDFFTNGDYKNIMYGKDLTTWYNQCLIEHGQRMLKMANDVLSQSSFMNKDIGFKIPGIHWQIVNPDMPRVAEITAGLINSRAIQCDDVGYATLLSKVIPPQLNKDKIVLHFTCLEMCNRYECDRSRQSGCNPGDATEDYSMASALVFWVASDASKFGIRLKGENALAISPYDNKVWDNISNALDKANYQGVTILRIENICKPQYSPVDNRFLRFMDQYKNQ